MGGYLLYETEEANSLTDHKSKRLHGLHSHRRERPSDKLKLRALVSCLRHFKTQTAVVRHPTSTCRKEGLLTDR